MWQGLLEYIDEEEIGWVVEYVVYAGNGEELGYENDSSHKSVQEIALNHGLEEFQYFASRSKDEEVSVTKFHDT